MIVVLSNVTPRLHYWLSASTAQMHASTHVRCPRQMLAHSCDIYCNYWLFVNQVFHFCVFHVRVSSIDMLKRSFLAFRGVTLRGWMYRLLCFGRTNCLQRKGSYHENIFIKKALYIHSSRVYAFYSINRQTRTKYSFTALFSFLYRATN